MSSFPSSLSGLQGAASLAEVAASRTAKAGPSPKSAVNLVEARNEAAAEVKAIKTTDQIQKKAIDLLA